MRTLKFIVNDQIITVDPKCDFSNLIPGSEGYLEAEFEFSPEWSGCVKVASFYGAKNKEYALVLENGKRCVIPLEVTKRPAFGVRVIGKNNEYKLVTNKAIVKQNGGQR